MSISAKFMSSKWVAFVSVSLMLMMMNIDLSGVTLALPSIAHDLNGTLTSLQWVLNSYAITAAAFVLFGACLGDIYGRVKFYFLGVLVFVVASLLMSASHSC